MSSSVVINSVQGEIQFFPISFVGFTLGHDWQYRDWDSTVFDCALVSCSGLIQRDYVITHLLYKYKNMLLVGSLENQNLSYDRQDVQYADTKTMMRMGPGFGTGLLAKAFVGFQANSQYILGYFTEWGEASSGDIRETHYLVLRWKPNPTWVLSVGAGSLRTTVLPVGFDLFLNLGWAHGEKLGFL
jgi:hypothetical protein